MTTRGHDVLLPRGGSNRVVVLEDALLSIAPNQKKETYRTFWEILLIGIWGHELKNLDEEMLYNIIVSLSTL